jgi:hypothetical protein
MKQDEVGCQRREVSLFRQELSLDDEANLCVCRI